MITTLRAGLSDKAITHLQIPPTTEDDYGLEQWVDLPHGTWLWADIPPVILDTSFCTGFGSQDVPSFQAWSSDGKVYHVREYDGAVSLVYALRNPPQ